MIRAELLKGWWPSIHHLTCSSVKTTIYLSYRLSDIQAQGMAGWILLGPLLHTESRHFPCTLRGFSLHATELTLPKDNGHIGSGSLPLGLIWTLVKILWVMVLPAFNPDTREAEASTPEFKASLLYMVSLSSRTVKPIQRDPGERSLGLNSKAEYRPSLRPLVQYMIIMKTSKRKLKATTKYYTIMVTRNTNFKLTILFMKIQVIWHKL